MSREPDKKASPDAAVQRPSLDRRRLLKVAAASAPIIATLPSGAAMANASARACIQTDFNDTHGDDTLGARAPNPSGGPVDRWLREAIPFGLATHPTLPTVNPAYEIKDGIYDINGRLLPDGYSFTRRGTVLAMKVYVPVNYPEQTIDPEMPTTVHETVPGIWPANQLSSDSHMGLSGSCLCSVNPDLA